MQKVNGFHDTHRRRIKIIAQVILHNWVFVQELIGGVAQSNDPHMTTLQGRSFADNSDG